MKRRTYVRIYKVSRGGKERSKKLIRQQSSNGSGGREKEEDLFEKGKIVANRINYLQRQAVDER